MQPTPRLLIHGRLRKFLLSGQVRLFKESSCCNHSEGKEAK